MRKEIEQLIQLQGLDETMASLEAGKKDLTARAVKADEAAAAAHGRLESRTSESKSFRSALDARELELKGTEEKINKLLTQLNTVKTNKEYTAIQHEIMGLRANKSKLEDEILQMMEQTESDRAELKRLKQEAEKAEAAAKESKAAIEKALADADARIRRIGSERAALAAQAPAEFLGPYERLRGKRDGRAMAACRNFVCEGCKMSVTANTVNLLMGGDKLVYCHSCGRILYLDTRDDAHGGIGAGRRE